LPEYTFGVLIARWGGKGGRHGRRGRTPNDFFIFV
jgi:hypothetical protein